LTELIYSKEKVQNGRTAAEKRECWVAGSFLVQGSTEALKLRRSLNTDGVSEFFVGTKSVTVEEYYRILFRNNVNTYAKNFLVMQGEAISLIEKSPKDLSLFFEYLSGSIVYKDKYDELKAEAEEKENDLKEQLQKLSHLKSERRKIREKIENSKEYNQLLKDHDEAELMVQLLRLLEVDGQCYEYLQKVKAYEEIVEDLKTKREDKSLKLQGLNINKRNLLGSFRKEQKNLETRKEEVSKLRTELTKDSTLREMTEQTLQAKRITKDKFERDLKTLKDNAKDYETEIVKVNEMLKSLEDKIKQKTQDPSEKLSGNDYEEYRTLTQKMKIKSHLLSQELEKLYNDQTIVVSRNEKAEEEKNRRKANIAKYEAELKETKAMEANKQTNIAKYTEDLKKLNAQYNEAANKKALKMRERESVQALRDQRNQLLMQQELLTLNQKDESKNKTLFTELFKTAKGFKGDLGSLISHIQPKFEIALRLALGPAMRYLVVDKNETALVCSNILKDRSVMKDILVLENIPEVNTLGLTAIRNHLGGLGNLASDIVDFDRSIVGLEKALLFLLEGKVVCDNLGKAEIIRKRNIDGVKQVITLDGSVIKKGVIIGYGNLEKLQQFGGQFANSVSRNTEEQLRELQKEIVEYEEKMKSLKTEEEDLELHRLLENIRETEGKISAENGAKEKLRLDADKLEDDLAKERKDLAGYLEDNKKIAKTKETNEKNIAGVKRELETLEQEIFGEFCKKRGIASVKEFRGQNIVEYEKTLEEREKLEKKVKILKRERDELPLQKYEATVKEVDAIIKEKEKTLKEVTERLAKNNRLMEVANGEYEKAKTAADKFLQEDQKLDREIAEIEKSFEGEKGTYVEKDKEKREMINNLNQLLQRKKEIMEELQIRSIEVPIAEEEDINTPRDLFEEYEDLFKKYLSNGRVDLDYSLLFNKSHHSNNQEGRQDAIEIESEESLDPEEKFKRWFEDMKGDRLKKDKDTYHTTLTVLAARIENYAGTSFPVGQESSRRLKNSEKEINEVKEVVSVLTKEHDEAVKRFEKVKIQRVTEFNNFFEKLSGKIDEVYKGLTKRADGTFGRAIIYKENKEEAYNGGVFYSATPPTKKFVYDVEQLSGGEKTMAGLALMLTANLVSEFPFMFFDESDAFLDQTNTKQLLEVIKLFAERNWMQFIVVTHKNLIFGNSQSLVGATFIPSKFTSECFSLDLRK